MAYDTKGITIEINGDGSGFEKTLRKIKAETQGLDKELSKVGKAMKSSFNSKGTGIELFIQKQGLLQTKYANLLKQEQAYRQALDATRATYQENLAAFGEFDSRTQAAAQNVQYLESELAILHSKLDAVGSSVLTCGTHMMAFHQHLGNVATAAEKAYQKLKPISLLSAGVIAAATAQTVAFEDAWVGVTKTVDGTPEQMEALNSGLKDLALNTASSYEQLAGFAELGGQMGVATDSMLTFTETVAMLGDTTNIAGEEAAQSLAQIANIMVDASDRTADYYERFGSTVVDLGNNFATTEADIVQMTQRLATAGRQVGMSTPQVMALATALGSMGIKAAEGGGSMSKLIKEIQQSVSKGGEGLEDFAATAGMTAEQFAQAWRDDAGSAFATFLEGIGKSGDVTGKLAELGIEEIRMSNATGALAQSTDLYTDALARADSAWESNTAMMTEAEKRYGTTKTALLQALEAIKQAGASLGESFAPTLKDIAVMVKDAAKWFAELPAPIKDTVAKMLLLGAAAAPAAKGISLVATGGQKVIETMFGLSGTAGKIAKIFGQTEKATARTAAAMGGYAKEALTAAAANGEATVSWAGLLGPAGSYLAILGAMGAALGIAVVAGNAWKDNIIEQKRETDAIYDANCRLIESSQEYSNSAKKHTEAAKNTAVEYKKNAEYASYLTDAITNLTSKENLSSVEKGRLKSAIEELNRIYPELGWSYDEASGKIKDETGALIDNTDKIRENVAAAEEAARQKALAKAFEETSAAAMEQKMAYDAASQSLTYANGEVTRLTKEYAAMTKGTAESEAKSRELTAATDLQAQARQRMNELQIDGVEANRMHLESLMQLDGGLDAIGPSMQAKYEEMIHASEQAGIQIPQKLSEGIQNGSAQPQAALQYMANLDVLNGMVDSSGMIGGAIPVSVANGILTNCGTVQEASFALNNLIQFSQAVANANLAGNQIPAGLIEGIASGAIGVDEAVKALGNGSVENLLRQAEYSAAGKSNADAYSNAQTQGVQQGSTQAASAGASAFNGGKISSAAGQEGSKAASKYGEGVQKIPGKTGTVLSDTASRFGGSSVPGAAGSMATSSAGAVQRGFSPIPGYAQAAYEGAKAWIDKIISMTNQNYTVKVTKEIKTVETKGERTVQSNSPLYRVMSLANPAGLFASASADPIANEANMGYAARNAVSPTTQAIQSAIDAQQGIVVGNQMQIASLSRKMDAVLERLTAVDFDGYLSTIAKNTAETQMVMDRRTIGKLIAPDVAKANNLDAAIRAKLTGG
ncbi:phage tail tape measure protein [Faecalibaculum rodentium]|uniref:phage tail tape measure protein n=2 Tax=Faecalibaculum TaxID=1729679 RepID=UPI0025A60224|nr:phage tail tape measure protein [Faecalibaculum rodentium]